jgi:hypothetical protein
VARAVIEFAGDISPLFPVMRKRITGMSYNPESDTAAFNYQGMAVVLKPRQIAIYKTESETVAHELIEWLKQVFTE